MSDTGATDEQIEAAHECWLATLYPDDDEREIVKESGDFRPDRTYALMTEWTACLVGADQRIVPASLVEALDVWRTGNWHDAMNLRDEYDAWKAGQR